MSRLSFMSQLVRVPKFCSEIAKRFLLHGQEGAIGKSKMAFGFLSAQSRSDLGLMLVIVFAKTLDACRLSW